MASSDDSMCNAGTRSSPPLSPSSGASFSEQSIPLDIGSLDPEAVSSIFRAAHYFTQNDRLALVDERRKNAALIAFLESTGHSIMEVNRFVSDGGCLLSGVTAGGALFPSGEVAVGVASGVVASAVDSQGCQFSAPSPVGFPLSGVISGDSRVQQGGLATSGLAVEPVVGFCAAVAGGMVAEGQAGYRVAAAGFSADPSAAKEAVSAGFSAGGQAGYRVAAAGFSADPCAAKEAVSAGFSAGGQAGFRVAAAGFSADPSAAKEAVSAGFLQVVRRLRVPSLQVLLSPIPPVLLLLLHLHLLKVWEIAWPHEMLT